MRCTDDVILRCTDDVIASHIPCRYLQENYLPFFSDIDDVVAAADYMSNADVLDGAWEHRKVLEVYGSVIAARGLLHANKTPATGSWRPLFKPRFFEARRKMAASVETLDDAIYVERSRGSPAFDPANAASATVTRMEILPTLAKVSFLRSRSRPSSNSAGGSNRGAGAGIGTLQSFSPGLAQLLHDSRSYTTLPSRGVTVDKDAAFSSDDGEEDAGGHSDDGSSAIGGEVAHASYSKGGASTNVGGIKGAASGTGPPLPSSSLLSSSSSSSSASTRQAKAPAAVADDIEDDIEDDSDF